MRPVTLGRQGWVVAPGVSLVVCKSVANRGCVWVGGRWWEQECSGPTLLSASPSAGYQPRWLRLKGNLLFYFKVTEAGSWDAEAGPKGVVVLVNCMVEKKSTADQPHAFTLSRCQGLGGAGWGCQGLGGRGEGARDWVGGVGMPGATCC